MTPPDRQDAETLSSFHRQLAGRLVDRGVATARLDARLLIQQALGLDHATFLAEPGRPVTAGERSRIESLATRRLDGEPVSRIAGEREFFGRSFVVTGAVLDPRPETELAVEVVLACLEPRRPTPPRLLDLGTGSGAIAVTALAERPALTALAVDIAEDALAVAWRNACRHGVDDRLSLAVSNWFDQVEGRFGIIVANPPYVPSGTLASLDRAVRDHDPAVALDGGEDGLDAYRAISAGAHEHLEPGGRVVLEIGCDQAASVMDLLAGSGYEDIVTHRDLAGLDRVVCATWPARKISLGNGAASR